MKWTDSLLIGEQLNAAHPDIDPKTLRFSLLRKLVLQLPDFDDAPEHCGEKVLEAIQAAWIEEADD
ncbi:MAG: Fe-S assembly protein IscX [Haemophilus parainfluenzae]|nr:MAG: Fe-S assembly protein IscX [Haemophilus parainfluenzae]